MRSAYNILLETSEGKGRNLPSRREYKCEAKLQELRRKSVGWIHLPKDCVQSRFLFYTITNLRLHKSKYLH
jgi:hypothetical protein